MPLDRTHHLNSIAGAITAALLLTMSGACINTEGVLLARQDAEVPLEDTPEPADLPLDLPPEDISEEVGEDTPEPEDVGMLEGFCEGQGPPVVGEVCLGELVPRFFGLALCVCEDFSAPQAVQSQLRQAPGPEPEHGAAIAIHGLFGTNDRVEVAGSLWVGHDSGLETPGDLTVDRDLSVVGGIRSSGNVRVERDVFSGGDIDVSQDLTIDGALHRPEGSELIVGGTRTVGEERLGPVDIELPCACDAPTDVDALIEIARDDNDNGANGLNAADLTDIEADVRLELPCGRFFFDIISGGASVTLHIESRAAIFVPEGVDLDGDFNIELAPDAELDLFIGGRLTLSSTFRAGDRGRPEALRVYVGRIEAINLAGVLNFSGGLYAPHSAIDATSGVEIFGAAFVRRMATSGSVSLFYEPALTQLDADCP